MDTISHASGIGAIHLYKTCSYIQVTKLVIQNVHQFISNNLPLLCFLYLYCLPSFLFVQNFTSCFKSIFVGSTTTSLHFRKFAFSSYVVSDFLLVCFISTGSSIFSRVQLDEVKSFIPVDSSKLFLILDLGVSSSIMIFL